MIRLIVRGFLIGVVNLGAGLTYVYLVELHREFAPWETFSILYRVPYDRDVSYVFLGSSHAARFAGCIEEVAAVQLALDGKAVHLAKTGSGVFQQRLFLQEFYVRGNRADTVVYFIDPFVFYSVYWNEDMPFIEFEPLDGTFAWSLVVGGVGFDRLHAYFRSKFSLAWFELRPHARRCTYKSVESVDKSLVAKRLSGMYWEGTSPENLARYLNELDRIVELTRTYDSGIVLMSMPTLLGPEPGDGAFLQAIRDREDRYALKYHEFREAIGEPAMFRDHDHLNTDGVALFMQEYVAPALRGAF